MVSSGRCAAGRCPATCSPTTSSTPSQPVKALIVLAGNPLFTIGGEERLREAFESLELIVCIDLYRNATGDLAHWLLPSTDMFERPDINITGLGLQSEPWIQWTDAVVEPHAERREEWRIFAALAQEMGFRSPLDADDPETEVWARTDHMLTGRGLSLDEVRAAPKGTVVFEDGLAAGEFYERHLQHADGLVDCCPDAFGPAIAALADEAVAATDAAASGGASTHQPSRHAHAQLVVLERREPQARRPLEQSVGRPRRRCHAPRCRRR